MLGVEPSNQQKDNPMEDALLKALAQAGPIGIVAALVFILYRQDRKDSEARMSRDREDSEKRYSGLVVDVRDTVRENTVSNKELTQVNTKLCAIIEYHASANGNGRRPQDKH
jgi:hypothetical protein